MSTWKIAIGSVVVSLLAAVLLYGAIITFFVYQKYERTFFDLSFLQSEVVSKLFVYGVIQSVDEANRSVTFTMSTPLTDTKTITAFIQESTTIAKQEMLAGPNGVYTGISEQTPGSFADLVPGTRIAVIVRKSGDILVANAVLFGNPL